MNTNSPDYSIFETDSNCNQKLKVFTFNKNPENPTTLITEQPQ